MASHESGCFTCGDKLAVYYYCCNKQEAVCDICSKISICTICRKRKNLPYNTKSSQSALRQQKQAICNNCKATCEKANDYLLFGCKHIVCLECVGIFIKNKIKFNGWEEDYKSDKTKKYIPCSCIDNKHQDITQFLKTHCLCCGQQFLKSKKILLKYDLLINADCRNRILYKLGEDRKLDAMDLIKLTKVCRQCTNVIDGFERIVGFEDDKQYQCKDCYTNRKKQKGEVLPRQAQKIQCTNCQQEFQKSNMIFQDNLFYLCQGCYHNSMKLQRSNKKESPKKIENIIQSKKENNGQVKQKESSKLRAQKPSLCLICDEYIASSTRSLQKSNICSYCQKTSSDSPLVQQLSKPKMPSKQSNDLRQQPSIEATQKVKEKQFSPSKEEKNYFGQASNVSELKPKFGLKASETNFCAKCDKSFQYFAKPNESEFSKLVCPSCLSNHVNQSILPLKRPHSQQIYNHKLPEKIIEPIYPSKKEIESWRKSNDYKAFLRGKDTFNFKELVRKEVGNTQEENQNMYKKKGKKQQVPKSIMYSVIQQYADVDFLEIDLAPSATAICSNCGYSIAKEQAQQYKSKNDMLELCLDCFFTCQAKNG